MTVTTSPSDPWRLKRTRFGDEAEYLQPLLDEFLDVLREVMDNPSYFPGIKDISRWRKGTSDLYENFKGVPPGFITWAVWEHTKRMPASRYIASPWTLRWLWEDYQYLRGKGKDRMCPRCGAGLLFCECDN